MPQSRKCRTRSVTVNSFLVVAIVWLAVLNCCNSLYAQECPPSWHQISPAPRFGHGFVYDSQRDLYVVFGGSYGWSNQTFADTWEYSPSESRWVQHASTGPAGQGFVSMVYDASRKQTVLQQTANGVARTWAWDGQTWSLIHTGGPQPGLMTYDSQRAVIVLVNDQTWEWDGKSWTKRNAASPEVSSAAITYDSHRNVTVLFGRQISASQNQTWEWDGKTWTSIPAGGPIALFDHSLAFDSNRNVVVLFGGQNLQDTLSALWEYDGKAWIHRTDLGPHKRQFPRLSFDSKRNQTVLSGGVSASLPFGDIWHWDGNQWQSSFFPPRQVQAMTYDTMRDQMVVVDTISSPPGVYRWDGQRWDGISTAFSIKQNVRLVFDSARSTVILFAFNLPNNSNSSEVWEFDGNIWTLRTQGGPPYRQDYDIALDSARNRVVMFGGAAAGSQYLNDTWEWDIASAQWILVPTQTMPQQRSRHAMTYDPQSGKVLLWSGRQGMTVYKDVWQWNGQSWMQIGQTSLGGNRVRLTYAGPMYGVVGLHESGHLYAWSELRWIRMPSQAFQHDSVGFVFDVASDTFLMCAASPFHTMEIDAIAPVPSDIVHNCHIDVADLLELLRNWGPCLPPPNSCNADVHPYPNGDGVVNVGDLLFLIANWG